MGIEQVILTAAENVQRWVNSFSGEATDENVDVERSRKAEVKRTRTKEQIRTAKARQAPPQPKAPPTRADVVAAYRKQRGLPNY